MKTIVLTEKKRLLGIVMWAPLPVLTSGLKASG